MALFIVETISSHRMRYAVEAHTLEDALDEVTVKNELYDEDWREMSQHHIGESISSSREVTSEEYLKVFDEDNEYLREWPDEQKFQFINHIVS
jgi:hypothetical protein